MNSVEYLPLLTDVWVMWKDRIVKTFIRDVEIIHNRDQGIIIKYSVPVEKGISDQRYNSRRVFISIEAALNSLAEECKKIGD